MGKDLGLDQQNDPPNGDHLFDKKVLQAWVANKQLLVPWTEPFREQPIHQKTVVMQKSEMGFSKHVALLESFRAEQHGRQQSCQSRSI